MPGMLRLTTTRGLVAAAAFTAACSSKDNPPPLAYCLAQSCNPTTIILGGGTGGAGGGIDSGNALGISLNVTLVGFTGSDIGPTAWSLSSVAELAGSFQVALRTPDGAVLTETGPSPIPFSNVLATSDGWVSATPETNSGLLPAIRNIPSDAAAGVSVPLLHSADFEFVPSLLSTGALTVDYTKSQVVIKIIDVNGKGVAGLKVFSLGSQVMAYASGSNWVDANTSPGTDDSGRVVAINLPANPQPVTFVSVSAQGLNLQGSLHTVSNSFPIQGGFVTYGTLLFQ